MILSIIVPMYHGKKYLHSILDQIEACTKIIDEDVSVELILYNDSPDEKILMPTKKYMFSITIINADFNSGIHGARVQGLKHAVGEYVLFLDQDDKIAPAYLNKQLECIGHADAVVCRAIHNKRFHYTDTHIFEKVITKDFMLRNWCPIVSPGQVLIKKEAIPALWTSNILKHNGADDYFLWLLMAAYNKRFALNQEVLFEHVMTGFNVSDDTNNMMDSESEMIQYLENHHVFSGEDEILLSKLSESLRKIHIKQLENYKRTFFFLQQWNLKLAENSCPMTFFQSNNIRKIAIYGAGDLGINLEVLLRNSMVEVYCFIDQNAGYIISHLPVYKKEALPQDIDAIILTVRNDSLRAELIKIAKCPVYEAEEIFIH